MDAKKNAYITPRLTEHGAVTQVTLIKDAYGGGPPWGSPGPPPGKGPKIKS
jgi:hypothetical protein